VNPSESESFGLILGSSGARDAGAGLRPRLVIDLLSPAFMRLNSECARSK
jgi:hypothetical protein